jgi:DNA polymerase III sliding clamp (beta) subunit (PCNA family)
MEFKIPVDDLHKIVSKLGSVVRVNTEDYTSMVLIKVGGDHVKFCGSNNTISITITSRECDVISSGKALIKLYDIKGYASRFAPISDGHGTEYFHFEMVDNQISLKTKTYFKNEKPNYRKLKIKSFETNLFPFVKEVEDAELILNTTTLRDGIASVIHCVNPNEITKSMTGVKVTINDDKLVFAGTNGVQLSECVLEVNADLKLKSMILRHDLASTLKNVLDNDSQVFIKIENTFIHFRCNDVYISGLLINEQYPNYDRNLSNYDKVLVVDTEPFADSVTALIDVLDPEDNHRLTIRVEDNKMILRNDRAESIQEIEVPDGLTLDIDVNGVYLSSLLTELVGDRLDICYVDGDNPIIFKPYGDDSHKVLLGHLRRR